MFKYVSLPHNDLSQNEWCIMVYFVSDLHLGIDADLSSLEREKQFCRWLDVIAQDATHLYIVGDLFDFWFEYKTVVPKGYVRVLGKLAALADAGLPIEFFIGNHDMWVFDYFEKELGIKTHRQPILRTIGSKKFYIGHGDGLGPGDYGYKFIKKVFANRLCQWAFERIHPNFGIGLANFWSGKSRKHANDPGHFLGKEYEWLCVFANEYLKKDNTIDYFIFGHRHLPIYVQLDHEKSYYLNLGEWLYSNSYAYFDGQEAKIGFFESKTNQVFP